MKVLDSPSPKRRPAIATGSFASSKRRACFPGRFPLNPSGKGRAVGHLESEVDQWIADRAAAREN